MFIKITCEANENRLFIYDYLPNYIYKTFISNVDLNRLKAFDTEYNIDSFNILCYILKHIKIYRVGQSDYYLEIDKNLKLNGVSIEPYFRLITYGNREIKGYPIIKNIFKIVSYNIDAIYEEWLNGY